MDAKLTKYLADVFRNELGGKADANSLDRQEGDTKPVLRRHPNHFVVDQKYSLRLDEII